MNGGDMGGGGGDGGGGGGDGGSGGDMGNGGGDMAPWGPPGLDVIAGQIGGFGNVDRTGPAARFTSLVSVAWDGAGNVYAGDQGGTRKIVVATGAVTTLAAPSLGASGVVFDGAGNLYGTTGYRIDKRVIATGAVTLLAGSNTAGSADGTGAAARFSGVAGMVFDGAGNLYVADTMNHTLRKIVLSTGVVTTVAGTAGISGSTDAMGAAARFNGPKGVAIDGAGNLYVADSGNYTIRQIVLATGVVTTIAGMTGTRGFTNGTGTGARFYDPTSMAVDAAGNLYICETSGTIRKLVLGTNAVTTIAGSAFTNRSVDGTGAAAGFNFPQGLTWDGAGNLYVADTHTLRKLVVATGAVTTVAGLDSAFGSTDGTGTAARFFQPYAVTWDGAGNLFVFDSGNFTIRKVVASTGVVTTLAGTPFAAGTSDGTGAAARFSQAFGVTADGAGNVYVADTMNHTIRKLVVATGVVTTLAGTAGANGSSDGTGAAARFFDPYGVLSDGAGNLYVADAGNSTIRQIATATGAVTTIAGTAGAAGSIDGTGAAARFQGPSDLTWDKAGTLYIADTSNAKIRKLVLATGAVTTVAGGSAGTGDGVGAGAHFISPRSIAYDGAGNLYVSDGQTVRKIVVATTAVTTIIGAAGQVGVLFGPFPAGLSAPRGVTWIPNQGLVICDFNENAVLIGRGL